MAYDLKGIELGKPATAATVKAALDLPAHCAGRNQYCFGGFTQVANVWVHTTLTTDASGAVAKIELEFDSGDFERLVKAAVAKYGAPTDTRVRTMQSGTGQQFPNSDGWWIDAAGSRVWIVQFLGSTTDGLMTLESASLRAKEKTKEEADASKSRM